jgi:hypothetical protein
MRSHKRKIAFQISQSLGSIYRLVCLIMIGLNSGCNLPARMNSPEPTVKKAPATFTPLPLPATSSPPTPTRTLTHVPSLTAIPTGTATPTATSLPTYVVLRGEVLVRANCRYGPGAPYLYKYGLVPGSNLEIIGRTDLGNWILIQAIDGNNPCWVKASLMDVKGDVMNVQPTYIPLPLSPYYPPLTGVFASRAGNEVTIGWNPVGLRAGDETAEAPYLVEAWLCSSGRVVFTPIGSHIPTVTVIDEPGCREPSHGRVYLVEKHGYTRWVDIPWPAWP